MPLRSLVVAAILLATLLPVPGAAAKAFTEDAAGDPQLRVFGNGAVPAPSALGEAADLLALDVIEDAESLTFTLKLQNLKQTASFSDYEIQFTWARDDYAIIVRRVVAQGVLDDNSDAYLVNVEESRWDGLARLEHEIDVESGTITVHLPKPYILSENGRYPLLGDELENVFVEARSSFSFLSFTSEAYDRMPDDEGVEAYAFQFGDVASGKLRIDADERVRVSNGGATTFVYEVTVTNKDDVDDEVDLILSDMPEGWNATVQSPLRLPGGAERRVAVLVSVPFAHDHGGFSSFNLSVRSARDAASFASVRMGVLHTPIPQPAGHHADLYLHASTFNSGIFGRIFPWTTASMNTDGNHDTDAPEAMPDRGGDSLRWFIPLDPMLRMGLDFDLERTGTIVGSIVGHMQSTGTVRAELLLVGVEGEDDEADGLLLGDTDTVDLALDVQTPAPFKLTFTPTEEADYIPYLRGQNIMLVLYYEPSEEGIGSICCMPGATPGLLTADFKATLPLNEYHDKLTAFSDDGDMLSLKAEGVVEKAGLPGSTLTYLFSLTNRGDEREVIDIDLAGTDAALATIVPGGSVTLDARETRKLTLAVTIPVDRNEGEELEVLVFAHAQEDPSKSAIARTKTIVAKQGASDVAGDETGVLLAAQEAEANETPAPSPFLAMGAVAIAALVLRRRLR